MTTPLEAAGRPYVFDVAETTTDVDFDAPSPRLGEAQRTRVRALEGMQKEALVTSTRSGTTWRLASDEGDYLDGDDVAPAPLAHMTTGMVSAFMTEVTTLLDERDVDADDVRLVQDNYYTMTGSALAGTMTGGALPVELDARIDADATEAELRDLVETAVERAPVTGLIRGEHPGRFSLALDGEPVSPDGVASIDGPALPDPAAAFERLVTDAPEREPPVLNRTGRTTEPLPEADQKYTAGEGSSLEEEQDRILHLRGTCSLRPDGLKHVEVEVFSPLGTVFELLSGEPDDDGPGRAPDAMTYVAAGIGFCFMTQLGRYADIADLDLAGYRITQDTHFSRGTDDAPADAAPVETHVFFDSAADEASARELLDMGEQTCFLHALCRTDLDGPNVSY